MRLKFLIHHHLATLALLFLPIDVLSLSSKTYAVTAALFLNHFPHHYQLSKDRNRNTKIHRNIRDYTRVPSRTMSGSSSFWAAWKWWEGLPRQEKSPPDSGKVKKRNAEPLVKKVTFVRHGCTYMNEYLSGKNGRRFGSYDFTDIFTSLDDQQKYHDTPLSPTGIEQATTLGSYIKRPPKFIETGCDLVIVSPLTRALQTFTLGIQPYLESSGSLSKVPIIATPLAAERLYLISDVGRPTSQLQREYPNIDFISEFNIHGDINNDVWWYQPNKNTAYDEWRPNGQNQKYACCGEPYDEFNVRMSQLYYYIQNRTENNIVVVCHHGVIDWFLDISFANCQYKQLPFTSIHPRTLIRDMDKLLQTTETTTTTTTVARL